MTIFNSEIFFNTGFELDATLTTVASGSSSVKVNFWNEYEALRLGVFEGESSNPFAEVKTSDVEDAVIGDSIIINSTTYYIREIQPNGTGITLLILSTEKI